MKKIAIIGKGKFGLKLFDKLKLMGKAEFIDSRDANFNFKERLNEVNLVVIATPSQTHYSVAKECLLAGKGVFVEKPLCITSVGAKELVSLAKEKELRLYVDDVFLYRREYEWLKETIDNKEIKRIVFSWKKLGTFGDSILNALVYHDLYLLLDLLGEGNIDNLEMTKVESPLEENRIDVLQFKFEYNGTSIECSYDRTFDGKEKSIKIFTEQDTLEWVNDQTVVNGEAKEPESNDALFSMLQKVLNKEVDYSKNNASALNAVKLLEEIKRKVETTKNI